MFHGSSLRRSHTPGLKLPTRKEPAARFNCLPVRCFMTSVTLWAKTSVMFVILLVTTDAGGGGFDLVVHALGVAGITIEPFVSAVEFKTGPCIVIKVPEFPVSYVVAVLALCTQPSSMDVLALMTAIAGGGCFLLIQLSCVATFAERNPVLA